MRPQEKMRKCASLKYMKADKIEFNPNEFQIGKSRIDTLPIMSRRASMPKI